MFNISFQNDSIGFPSDISSVVSSIVLEGDCTVVEVPIFDSWKGWLTGDISIPIFVDVNLQSVDNTSGGFSLIIQFTSIDGVGNGTISGNCTGGVSVQWTVVKLRWPGSICSVISTIVVKGDWTIVVNPESNSSETVGSLGENVPSFPNSW